LAYDGERSTTAAIDVCVSLLVEDDSHLGESLHRALQLANGAPDDEVAHLEIAYQAEERGSKSVRNSKMA